MQKTILALAGERACGKGALAQYMVKQHGAEIYRFSKVLGEILDRLYLDKSRDNFCNLSVSLRNLYGQDILSEVTRHDIEWSNAKYIIIDGVRREGDIACFRNLPGFQFIFIDADASVRYARTITRNEKIGESAKTFEEFVAEDSLETEASIHPLREIADVVLENNGTIEELERQFEKALKMDSNTPKI